MKSYFYLAKTTRKPQNLDPANLYNILEYEQGQVKVDNLTTQRSFNWTKSLR
jgi:hypothetical protein